MQPVHSKNYGKLLFDSMVKQINDNLAVLASIGTFAIDECYSEYALKELVWDSEKDKLTIRLMERKNKNLEENT
jgi:hypothetical protein